MATFGNLGISGSRSSSLWYVLSYPRHFGAVLWEPPPEHFDVLIIGAGLSGIDAAHHLQKFCPEKSYVILEQRERIGGTWDLFRYPGIRSDSDMLTMGYSFRPWTHPKAISPGEDIREYITATARDEGIDRNIRFRHQIMRASWSSEEAKWTVEAMRKAPSSDASRYCRSFNLWRG